jgi:hypothetical protein
MSIHPMFTEEAKHNAQFHLQVKLNHDSSAEEADFGPRGHGEFTVKAAIKRIFRSDQRLSLEDEISFSVYISEDILIGPASIRPRDFDTARYMEVFLNGGPPDCKLAGLECFYLIEKLTIEPTQTINTELTRKAELMRESPPIRTLTEGKPPNKPLASSPKDTSTGPTDTPFEIPEDWDKT